MTPVHGFFMMFYYDVLAWMFYYDVRAWTFACFTMFVIGRFVVQCFTMTSVRGHQHRLN